MLWLEIALIVAVATLYALVKMFIRSRRQVLRRFTRQENRVVTRILNGQASEKDLEYARRHGFERIVKSADELGRIFRKSVPPTEERTQD